MGDWYAHSDENSPEERWHRLSDHLGAVGERAGLRAKQFGAESMGRAAGLLHDVGKYSAPFQAKLKGAPRRVDHSTAGAILADQRYWAGRTPIGRLIAAAIAGHHAGLADGHGSGERTALEVRLRQAPGKDLPALDPCWETEIALPPRLEVPPIRPHPIRAVAEKRLGFQLAFLVRMLFSCLVDADYLDTENWFAGLDDRTRPRGDWPKPARLEAALATYLAGFAGRTSEVDFARAEVLEACRNAAARPPGLFSLMVPTGGGKTLSGLAFALAHAARWHLDRVIYVAPFTSVIEQNANAFRKALGPHGEAVLEHHSAFRDNPLLKECADRGGERGPEAREKLKLAMENWDAPVVATTAVQFFESLFAAAPSRCRKLHNIARSVVILDEAQTLPLKLLRPCVAAIDELARNYGTTIVLCTATQPAIEDDPRRPDGENFKGGLRDVRPIVSSEQRDSLFRRLRRVRFERLGEVDDEALASMLREREQVLCIVNTRGHARALFERLRDEPGVRHLSTWMCAVHRASVLGEIRHDLADGRPCRVVCTSLVEAGVDVDFPSVFRAEAGLDSIAQAAGRCNREGRRPVEESVVLIFSPAEAKTPLEIAQYAQKMREILGHYEDPLSPPAIEAYFRAVYWSRSVGRDDGLDEPGILPGLNAGWRDLLFPFETVEKSFRIIDDWQQPVIIPFDDEARRQLEALRYAPRVDAIARKLQPYTVPVPSGVFAKLFDACPPAIGSVREDARQFFELRNPSLYRGDVGLVWDDPIFVAVESAIL